MDEQTKSIGKRLHEIRTILEISAAEMAELTNMTETQYLARERGEVDCHFSFLYDCAKRFGVDLNSIVTGQSPKLSNYTLTRAGGGVGIERSHEFKYHQLATSFKSRMTEPLFVVAKPQRPGLPIPLSTHPGQEFDYVLKGKLKVRIGDKTEILAQGDSLYYDSNIPHGMVAVECDECEFLAIPIMGEAKKAEVPTPVKSTASIVNPNEKRICPVS